MCVSDLIGSFWIDLAGFKYKKPLQVQIVINIFNLKFEQPLPNYCWSSTLTTDIHFTHKHEKK